MVLQREIKVAIAEASMEYNDKTSLTLRSVESMQFTMNKASKNPSNYKKE